MGESRRCHLKEIEPEESQLKKSMAEWQFAPSSVLENNLPIDSDTETYICSNVKGVIYSRVKPSPLVKNVRLVAYSKDVLVNILNMHPSITETDEFVKWVAGSNVLSSSTPLAHRYGGHQFGAWAGQLGDGRAMSLGEHISHDGKRWEIQLKGSGLTPYSRGGDGRAVLRSSIREFLCSEAMHALGIPTTRAAAIVVSDDAVIRDQFYDGRPEVEKASVVMRIAPSFLRFGSLEILSKNIELSELRRLLNYIIQLRPDITECGDQKYFVLLEQIIQESINLVVAWASFGFTHGVLNTDNMSMFGVTIDYGPFGFLEKFDRNYICNSSDSTGRYAFCDQLPVVQWNLTKLYMAVKVLLSEPEQKRIEVLLRNAVAAGEAQYAMAFNEKLGFITNPNITPQLSRFLIEMMEETGSDFTMTFRQLGFVTIDEMADAKALEKHWSLNILSKHSKYLEFVSLYKQCMAVEGLSDEQRRSNMMTKNPQYVLRNWMAQQAIKQADQNDFSGVNFLLEILSKPFTINEEAEKKGFSGPTPAWADCIRVSCSS
ncbi:hypothetical protein FOCC_FOCC013388 [Frankliniella occidentalis]|nr:protein adenylyltransferase SelO, mitochondrial isoform X2 [Frankliniella occidentalis]XP_026271681.1 protein adenylyltransferase SelO, mitochondrial isoform X2 [Frankliniella occidentalis]KAE8741130.1 hypothetical protein FOCC_FOCC013388 [Frankliniella occidentalis]